MVVASSQLRFSIVRMFAIATLLLALVSPSKAQRRVRDFVLRVNEEQPLADAGSNESCILVLPDKRYRVEKVHHGWGNRLDASAFEGQLPDDEFRRVKAILDDEDFRRLAQTAVPVTAPFVNDYDSVVIWVLRSNKLQELSFPTVSSRKPFSSAVDPVVNWFRRATRVHTSAIDPARMSHCSPELAPRVPTTPAPKPVQ
jgi:hypothetical protein